jgi:hypothetical protein
MTAGEQQIVTCFETLNLDPAQIADSLGLDETAVKSVLVCRSNKYRMSLKYDQDMGGVKVDEDISDDEFQQIRQAALGIALNPDPEFIPTKAKMIRFLWNEKKGRNNVQKTQQMSVSVYLLNDQIRKAKDAVQRMLSQTNPIDVESEICPGK